MDSYSVSYFPNFDCSIPHPHSAFCAHDSGGSLAQNGALKVNKHMQVEGFDNIYAIGDCANVNEPKMAYHAGLHAGVAVKNIINSLTGKSLTSYNTGKRISGPMYASNVHELV